MSSTGGGGRQDSVRKVLIVSVDDPYKGGGVGGKHTHIRLLADGLQILGVPVQIAAVKNTLSFRLLRRYPGAVRRRLLRSRDERYAHYMGQHAAELMRVLGRQPLDDMIANPQDVVSADVLREALEKKSIQMRTVLTLHGYFTMEATSDKELHEGSPQYVRFKETEKRVYEHATRIICVDSKIRDYVLSMSSTRAEKVAVIPNAVDVNLFRPPTPDQKNAYRKELEIPEDALVVLCPRRLVAKNGVKFAVQAMIRVAKSNPKAILIQAGDGPEERCIEDLISQGRLWETVRMVGSVPHERIVKFYGASDLVLIPSVASAGVEEATSLAMLEGMASGKPVIVTDIGGLKET
ncbi:MAG: hypothetical protein A3K76_01515, partial [Euryarchaeota archaeon RBG_13_57_23]